MVECLRFRAFKKYAKPDDVYSAWNYERIKEWALASGRQAEVDKERHDGWQFPLLVSEEHHKEFDYWLKTNYPVGEEGFDCTCGEFHKYPLYVYAHTGERLTFTCPKCGIKYIIFGLTATPAEVQS